MTTTYCSTEDVHKFLHTYITVPTVNSSTPEEVGEGDGSTTVFYLDNRNVIAGTYTLYHAASWSESATELTETTHYTINKDDGKITLTASGVTEVGTDKIYAKYKYANVSDSYVADLINAKEDEIDQATQHAWRETTVTDELHDFNMLYKLYGGVPVYLNHRKVKEFDHDKGDKIEVWDGNTWDDWVTSHTTGRANDWWADYEKGIIFIKYLFPFGVEKKIRVTYRYGESSVPNDIKNACVKLVAYDLVHSDDRSVLFPEGSSNIPLVNKAENWLKDAEKIIMRHQEISIVSD